MSEAGCYKGAIAGNSGSTLAQALEVCPMMEPVLSIETGMHTGPIRSISVDRECRLLCEHGEEAQQIQRVGMISIERKRLSAALLRLTQPPGLQKPQACLKICGGRSWGGVRRV